MQRLSNSGLELYLERHQVVDLLPDRTVESFAAWLQHHPEVVTVARDRCGVYAEGAARGIPQAQQVADPFHLVMNLSAQVERVLEERSQQLVLAETREQRAREPEPSSSGNEPEVKALPLVWSKRNNAANAGSNSISKWWRSMKQACQKAKCVDKRSWAGTPCCAAVNTDWSNGQAEGQINRLKTIKRQRYGRAGFTLLRARVLPYCPAFSVTGSSPISVNRKR